MPKRYDLKEVEEILKGKRLYLIEKEYKNSKNKLKLIDCNGYKYYNSLSNIIDGKKIDKFSSHNPYTVDNIRLWLKESGYKIN